ncbi:MAG TPA: single-stranded-DNA-specific exonuclease RecJ [Chitinophagaceae bacterium]|nr:single-stranded-DNA-specific exonuclease RecJ [Chitinophagaceae bacterium]
MEKRWNLLSTDEAIVARLQQTLRIHPVLCRLLALRHLATFDQARNFFRPRLEDLHDPWKMKDMDKAVSRICQALERKEKILVYGDYDVDGTTAVASLYRFLSAVHQELDFYIPHRYTEGYGVSRAGIDFAARHGFTLIISLDCGIKSTELVAYARTQGIDFIICDHHLPDAELPGAVAILNPKQPGCPYPYKELCGCGVGFKLITALAGVLGLPPARAFEFLDLAATAIAADIVPMDGENRILAYYGLRKANEDPNPGIRALAELSGLKGELHIQNLVFMIAPRVNAAGRMDNARKAVQLFLARSHAEALQYAQQLHTDNSERKEADSLITEEALAQIATDPLASRRKTTVVYQPHWHKGVVGIVASRLIEHYYRPTVVLTRSGDYAAGSARSVPGFNLYEAVHACREHLLGYGGHFAAAGMSLALDQIEPFREKFEQVVSSSIRPEQLVPEIPVDAEITLQDIREPFYNILRQMEPFGPENPRPVFLARRVQDTGMSRILKERHVRFVVRQDQTTLNGIGFGLAPKFDLLREGNPLDLVFRIEENEWNGRKSLQLHVIDLRASDPAGAGSPTA